MRPDRSRRLCNPDLRMHLCQLIANYSASRGDATESRADFTAGCHVGIAPARTAQNEAHNNGNPADPEIKARNRASKTIRKTCNTD